MAGDTLRDAFRAELAAVCNTAGVSWPIIDIINADDGQPDAGVNGWIAIEFVGGSEEQFTTGAPGSNLFRENGQVTVRVYAPQAASAAMRDQAEAYAESIRNAFRARRFAAGSRMIRIDSTAPLGLGQSDGGLWAESVALGYEIFNVA